MFQCCHGHFYPLGMRMIGLYSEWKVMVPLGSLTWYDDVSAVKHPKEQSKERDIFRFQPWFLGYQTITQVSSLIPFWYKSLRMPADSVFPEYQASLQGGPAHLAADVTMWVHEQQACVDICKYGGKLHMISCRIMHRLLFFVFVPVWSLCCDLCEKHRRA